MSKPAEDLRSQIGSATRAVEYARRVANQDESKLELLVDHMHTLAELRVHDGDFPRAESLLREAMFRIEDANANHRQRPRPILAANVASSLGYLYDRWNRGEQARKWYGKSLEMAEAGNFFHSDLGASVSNNLGMLDKKSGELESAERHYLKSLRIFRSLKGAESSEAAAVLNNLGVLHYTKGNQADALKAHLEAMNIRQTLHNAATGEGSQDLIQTWRNLAAVYKAQGNAEKAAILLRQAGVTDEQTTEATTPNWVIKTPTQQPFVETKRNGNETHANSKPSASVFRVEVHR